MAASPLLSQGATIGQNCYVTPAFSGVPNTGCGGKIRKAYLTHAFSGAQKRAELLRNPCILGRPERPARGGNEKWLPHPWVLGGPKEGASIT